jgi:hypothetical protein
VRAEEFQGFHCFTEFVRIDLSQQVAEGSPGIAKSPGLVLCRFPALEKKLLPSTRRRYGRGNVESPAVTDLDRLPTDGANVFLSHPSLDLANLLWGWVTHLESPLNLHLECTSLHPKVKPPLGITASWRADQLPLEQKARDPHPAQPGAGHV